MLGFGKKKQTPTMMYHCTLACPKSKQCQWWIEFNNRIATEDGAIKNVLEGRCAMVWIPTLLLEIKNVIESGRTNEGSNQKIPG